MAAFTYFTLDIKSVKTNSVASTIKDFDYIGIILLIVGVTEL